MIWNDAIGISTIADRFKWWSSFWLVIKVLVVHNVVLRLQSVAEMILPGFQCVLEMLLVLVV